MEDRNAQLNIGAQEMEPTPMSDEMGMTPRSLALPSRSESTKAQHLSHTGSADTSIPRTFGGKSWTPSRWKSIDLGFGRFVEDIPVRQLNSDDGLEDGFAVMMIKGDRRHCWDPSKVVPLNANTVVTLTFPE